MLFLFVAMTIAAHRSPPRSQQTLRAAVDRVLAERGQPTAWSVIMTVLGDAVVPRGGRIWTGSLLEILSLLGFGGGVLRTALSRLVADGWVTSSKSGRRSFYELTERGRTETLAAAGRIYRIGAPGWDGTWCVALLTEADAARRGELRSALVAQGYAAASADTLVRVGTRGMRIEAPPGVAIVTGECVDAAGASQLAARAWSLDTVAESYRALERTLAPVLDAAVPASGGEADALAARILLVHELRRVVLRDPDLPAALLPAAWDGERVRRRIGERYRRLYAPSERWLDARAQGEDGPLPAPREALAARFAE